MIGLQERLAWKGKLLIGKTEAAHILRQKAGKSSDSGSNPGAGQMSVALTPSCLGLVGDDLWQLQRHRIIHVDQYPK